MSTYHHTQVSRITIGILTAMAYFLASIYLSAAAELPSVNSGPNLLVVAVMVLILATAASFISLTVTLDEKTLRIKFGYGLFRKTFARKEIATATVVRNKWYYGWGVKKLFWPNMWIFSVSGLDAVEIVLNNGDVYRIGTDQPHELAAAIRQK